jgi:hypothetical protein
VNAPPQYGQSTLDTVITATPSPTSAFDPEDVFESLQLLPSTLIGPVCTCIEAPEVVVAISALPVGENTEWIMETVTVFTTAYVWPTQALLSASNNVIGFHSS